MLCPNCHTQAHLGIISTEELLARRKELSGEVDRESGGLSLNGNDYNINIGGVCFTGTRHVFVYENMNLLSLLQENNTLFISCRLHDKEGRLICWMHNNKWWIENKEILEFTRSKDEFNVVGSEARLNIKVDKDNKRIALSGEIFINKKTLQFGEEGIIYSDSSSIVIRCGTFQEFNAIRIFKNGSIGIGG